MAITFITGIPRSGKSYYAMYQLYKTFIEKKKDPSPFQKVFSSLFAQKTLSKSWDIAYTNINQFDFSKSDKIKPYDFNTIQLKLTQLYNMCVAKANDDVLIENAKIFGLYNCLFVIDEAQNFFSEDNAVTTWWLTYHGHLHHDIILITQNLDLIEKSYFKLAEFYYKAVPPSSRLFSGKFRYIQFNSYRLYKGDRIGDFHVPMEKQIFDMYVSGAANPTKSVVKRYLVWFLILCVIVVLLFINFLSMFNTNVPKTETNTTSTTKELNVTSLPTAPYDLNQFKETPKHSQKVDRDTTQDQLFEVRCFDMLCNYKGVDFPKPLFNKITTKLSPDFIWFFQNSSYIQYFVMLPSDTFDFLQIGEKENEKNTNKERAVKAIPNPLGVAPTHK